MSGVVSVGVAVAAIGVAAEVGTTFAIIAAVGATVGAIGAVTGVKELQYAGMALGAVGGIGGLASSAGMFAGEAASLADVAAGTTAAETASPFGGSIDAEIANWSTYGAEASTASAQGAMPDVINQVNGVTPEATLPPGGNEQIAPGSSGVIGDATPDAAAANAQSPTVTPGAATDTGVAATPQTGPDATAGTGTTLTEPAAAPPAQQPTGSLINSNDADLARTTVTTQPADTAPVTGTTTGQPAGQVTGANTGAVNGGQVPYGAPTGAAGTSPVTGQVTVAATTTPTVPPGGTPDSIWKDIMGVIGKPGVSTLLSGAVQAGGAFIAGATSTLTPAQIRALNAQAEANTAATNLANQNAALATNQLKNFTGPTPRAFLKPDNMGIINQTPPVTGQVTA